MWLWVFVFVVLVYEVVHLLAELFMGVRPGWGCRAVVVVPSRRPVDLSGFVGVADFVVVDDEFDAAVAERAGLRWILNRYGGKSGAVATALEVLDADVYVFVDDDAEPGVWLEELKKCRGGFVTAYRWVRDVFQNGFSLGGFDWMVWRRTRFVYGGAMAVPRSARWSAVEVLRRCEIDDMALTRVAGDIEVLPVFVPMRPAAGSWDFFVRQAAAARLGNPGLWLVEFLYYLLWVVAAVLFPPLFVVHMLRTALRSRRALGRVSWGQVAFSPFERFLVVVVFAVSGFRRCFYWRGRRVCGGCS